MTTHEIPRQAWKQFLTSVSERLESRRARIEVDSDEFGAQVEADNAQLRSIDLIEKGNLAGAIEIDLGGVEASDDIDDHRILAAVRLLALQGDGGGIECIAVEAQDGSKTLIRFSEPLMLPADTGEEAGAPG